MKKVTAIFITFFLAGCEEHEARAKRDHEYKMECLKIGGLLMEGRNNLTCVRPARETKPHD